MNDDERANEGMKALATAAGSAPDEGFEAAGDFRDGERIEGTEYIVRGRPLGRGGHAILYRCEDAIGRIVALKVLQRHHAKRPELLAGMVDEARRQVRLRHPKVVEVYKAGVTSGPKPIAFIEMELLVGGNGRQLLQRKKRVEVVNALDLLIDICDALSVAHGLGIVHQDLKPENIFIHFDQYTDKATTKLLDFGVARIIGQAYNSFEGTLPYAGPEQLTGGDVTALTDLYALGTLMFEFITGRRPFEKAENDDREELDRNRPLIQAGRAEEASFCANLVRAKTETDAPRISEIADDIYMPRELEDIVVALLARDPKRRILPHEVERAAAERGALDHDLARGRLTEAEIREREKRATPQEASASELAKRLRALRALPGLQKTNMTTQELLSTALREKSVKKGQTLKMNIAGPPPPPVDAPAAPQVGSPPAAVEARAGAVDAGGAPAGLAYAATVPDAPLPFGAEENALPSPAPRADRSDPLRSWPPSVRTDPLPQIPIRERSAETIHTPDAGPAPAGAILGTLDPVAGLPQRDPARAPSQPPALGKTPRVALYGVALLIVAVGGIALASVLHVGRRGHPSNVGAASPTTEPIASPAPPGPRDVPAPPPPPEAIRTSESAPAPMASVAPNAVTVPPVPSASAIPRADSTTDVPPGGARGSDSAAAMNSAGTAPPLDPSKMPPKPRHSSPRSAPTARDPILDRLELDDAPAKKSAPKRPGAGR